MVQLLYAVITGTYLTIVVRWLLVL